MAGTITRKTTRPGRWLERGPLLSLRDEMDELFQNFFGDSTSPRTREEIVPRFDVSETDDAMEVKTDLPGVKADEIDIDITENVLTIRGHHEEQTESDENGGRKYHRIERQSGHFSRSVWLPCGVQEDKIDAQLHDGILTVTLPKKDEEKPHKVKVKG